LKTCILEFALLIDRKPGNGFWMLLVLLFLIAGTWKIFGFHCGLEGSSSVKKGAWSKFDDKRRIT